MTGYLPREITPRLERALRQLPVVVLSGLRQTGKSTLLQNEAGLARGHTYRTLDDFATLAAAQANPGIVAGRRRDPRRSAALPGTARRAEEECG